MSFVSSPCCFLGQRSSSQHMPLGEEKWEFMKAQDQLSILLLRVTHVPLCTFCFLSIKACFLVSPGIYQDKNNILPIKGDSQEQTADIFRINNTISHICIFSFHYTNNEKTQKILKKHRATLPITSKFLSLQIIADTNILMYLKQFSQRIFIRKLFCIIVWCWLNGTH